MYVVTPLVEADAEYERRGASTVLPRYSKSCSVEHCRFRRRTSSFQRNPWSHQCCLHLTTGFSPHCSINRYYDPATDQFLSVDPDVAETDQPYVFTNDDPLNAEDPRGLQGSSGLVASQDYRNAVAKKCDGHPDRDGCRGLDLGKDVLKITIITSAVVGGAACVVATAGVCGAAAFTVGGVELSGGAIAIGIATGAAEGSLEYSLDPGRHTMTGYFENVAKGAGIDALFVGVPEEAIFGGLGEGAHAAELNWAQALKYLPKYLQSVFK